MPTESGEWSNLTRHNIVLLMEKANERSGHLMVSDYRRPRHRATPEELQLLCRPLRWVGRRSPALPDAKRHKATTSVESAHAC